MIEEYELERILLYEIHTKFCNEKYRLLLNLC